MDVIELLRYFDLIKANPFFQPRLLLFFQVCRKLKLLCLSPSWVPIAWSQVWLFHLASALSGYFTVFKTSFCFFPILRSSPQSWHWFWYFWSISGLLRVKWKIDHWLFFCGVASLWHEALVISDESFFLFPIIPLFEMNFEEVIWSYDYKNKSSS